MEKIQVSIKPIAAIGTVHVDRYVYIPDNILMPFSQNEKCLTLSFREERKIFHGA
jgi:hypothetical protein